MLHEVLKGEIHSCHYPLLVPIVLAEAIYLVHNRWEQTSVPRHHRLGNETNKRAGISWLRVSYVRAVETYSIVGSVIPFRELNRRKSGPVSFIMCHYGGQESLCVLDSAMKQYHMSMVETEIYQSAKMVHLAYSGGSMKPPSISRPLYNPKEKVRLPKNRFL